MTTGPTLYVEYRLITNFPTSRGNLRIKVQPDGGVYSLLMDWDCPERAPFCLPYPTTPQRILEPRQMARLVQFIQRHDFFSWQSVGAGLSNDGYREEIEVHLDGRSHTIEAHNGKGPPDFQELKQDLLDWGRN